MFIENEGLFNNIQLKQDIPVGRFKPYEYSNKNFEDTKNKIPVVGISLNSVDSKLSLTNGLLKANKKEYDITCLKLEELLSILVLDGVCNYNFITGYEVFKYMPAIMLSNFNTEHYDQIEGVESPLALEEYLTENRSILNIDNKISSIDIFDIGTNKVKPFTWTENNELFYDVSTTTRIIIRSSSISFILFADYDSKYSIFGSSVGNLIGIGGNVG